MKTARLDAMEQYILQNEQVTISDLKRHFEVSINTSGADLDELEAQGPRFQGLRRGGGCARASLISMPRRFQMSAGQAPDWRTGAAAIPDNTTVFIDSGSTTYNVIRHLGAKGADAGHPQHDRHRTRPAASGAQRSAGGIYNASLGAFVGSPAWIPSGHAVGAHPPMAHGVSIKRGLTNTTYFEAEIKRVISPPTVKRSC